jgi:hypothetical protein
MSNEYTRPFYEIVCGLNNYKLGTIIESETGQRYKLTKTDNEYRKFSRIDKGLRFLTYENMNKKFRIVEEQEEIDIQELEEIKEMKVFLSVDTRQTLEENLKKIDKHEVNFFFKINEIIRKQNKIVQYLEQLDRNIKEKQ